MFKLPFSVSRMDKFKENLPLVTNNFTTSETSDWNDHFYLLDLFTI